MSNDVQRPQPRPGGAGTAPPLSRILVLCTGNICRSPMGVALLGRALGNRFQVESAGLSALSGHAADPSAVQVMSDAGMDIRTHRARQVDDSLLRAADLILVMDGGQKSETESQWPWTRGKVFRFGHWENQDVDDPYRRPTAAFLEAFRRLEIASRSWAEHVGDH